MPGEDIKTKVCSKCGKELPMTDEYFYKKGDKYRSECKECHNKYHKKYCEAHKDQIRESKRKYYETHKDKEYERKKKFRETHKEEQNQCRRNYYARVKDTPEFKEKAKQKSRYRQRIKNEFLAKWRRPCQKCGEQRLYLIQFHHIDPATKEFNISTSVGNKKTEICEEEVKKCVCLCSNCHDEFHYFYGKNPEDPVNAIKEYLKD